MKKLVSTRQLIYILVISVMTLKVLLLPNLMVKAFSRDVPWYFFFLLVVDYLTLFIYLFLMNKFPDMTFYEILEYFFGKVVGRFIMLFFFVFFYLKCCAIFHSNFVYLNENLYATYDWVVFSVPILVCIVFTTMHCVNALARLVEFFFPLIIIGFLVSLSSGFFRADFNYLMPFMENGVGNIAEVFKFFFWFGDYTILIVFLGNIKTEKLFNLKILIWPLVCILLLTLFYVLFYATYNYNCICHTNAISDMLQVLPSVSDIGSFDWILILIWDIAFYLCFAINTLGAFYSFRQALFKKWQTFVSIFVAGAVFVANYILSFDTYISVGIVQNYLWIYSVVVGLGFPFVIFIFGIFKKGVKNGQVVQK